MRVLIVEDEAKMAGLLRKGLKQEGIAADRAAKGEDALWMAGSTEYDAIVLDLMLPGIDGFEVCRRLRDDGVWSPVLMLTARDGVADRVAGLDTGADDYLVKPFSYAELLARLRALAPGRRGSARPSFRSGDLRLDPAKRQVWRRERRSSSRPRSSPCSRCSCGGRARSSPGSSCSNTPGTTSTRIAPTSSTPTCGCLRKKIDKPFGADSIQTVRGAGLPAARERRVREPALHPPANHPRLRGGDGGASRGPRPVHLPEVRELSSMRRSTTG